ncbi:Tryptophan--tRNA ligase, mitochondrial [Marasmius tenuissimus]|uniref:tryptophan--tRNA ligase n=1 Tax=Marasmius tenuissimus TaxID=585030 RepID=A0ABR3A1X4_9AGAR
MGKLRRMTTWKSRLATSKNLQDDSDVDETNLNARPPDRRPETFLNLLYRATHVPVGEDQTQHLELTRDLADQFNRTFKASQRMFPLPTQLSTPSKRILSLRDPTSKMSKSAPDAASRILLTDSPNEIASKIRVAVTDSIPGITYDPVNRPGTANLLTILAAARGEDVHETVKAYESQNHGALKRDITEVIQEMLRKPREEFQRLKIENGYLEEIAREGKEKAIEKAEQTMQEVRKRVGLS